MNKLLSVLVISAMIASPTFASSDVGDVEAGEKVFKKCAACHTVDNSTKKRSGPSLDGVFGRTAGTLEGYKYSKGMIAAGEGGLVWTEETMALWLTKPRDLIKKNKMAFAGLKKEEDIKNVEAYLLTFSPDYVAEDSEDDDDDDKKSD